MKRLAKNKEILLYVIFGAVTTAVNFVIYSLLVEILQCNITLSNTIAWFCAIVFAFITNKLIVFESKQFHFTLLIKEVLSFFGARIISGIIEIFVPECLFKLGFDFEIFGIRGLAAKALVNIIVIVLNYNVV